MSIVRSKFRLLLMATLVIAAVAVIALVKRGSAASAVSHESESVVAPQRGRVQLVRFTLYDVGIYPQEARANPGAVTLSIEDLTGSNSEVFIERIEPAGRTVTGTMNKPANQLRSRAQFSLGAGRYEIVDAARPDNRAGRFARTH